MSTITTHRAEVRLLQNRPIQPVASRLLAKARRFKAFVGRPCWFNWWALNGGNWRKRRTGICGNGSLLQKPVNSTACPSDQVFGHFN